MTASDKPVTDVPRPHKWVASTLGHGESMCEYCRGTNRELAILGELDHCEKAPATTPDLPEYVQVPRDPTDEMLAHFSGAAGYGGRFNELPRAKQEAERKAYAAMLAAAPVPAPTKPLPEAGREGVERAARLGWEFGRRAWCDATILADHARTESEWAAAKEEIVPALDALTTPSEAASPQSSVEQPLHASVQKAVERAAEILLASPHFYSSNGILQIACNDRAEADELLHILRGFTESATPEQGGREAVAWQRRPLTPGKDEWVTLRNADELQDAHDRGLEVRPLFTTPRSEEDIRKAVVEGLEKIADEASRGLDEGDTREALIDIKFRARSTLAALHSPADRSAS